MVAVPIFKVKFVTVGCKVNQYETQALREEFERSGCVTAERGERADICVINTCTVTSRADVKSRNAILMAKRENPAAKIVLCGCMARPDSDKVKGMVVDCVVPQEKKHSVVDIVLGRPVDGKDVWSMKVSRFLNARAFIKVQDGCDNACSFCTIPYLRGRSRSRAREDVTEEIKRVSLHHREIVLCGVNLGLYGRDLERPGALHSLVGDIIEIDSLGRLRLSSLEPYLITDELLALLSHKKMCPHLHLPFQSGDDRVLRDMRKKESVLLYERVVEKARAVNPFVAISCDIMVGFPSEDEKSFENTVKFIKRIKPMRTHLFRFSPREGTPLAGIRVRNQDLIRKRFEFLKDLAEGLALDYKKSFAGKILHMVAEEEKNGSSCGYTENYIRLSLRGKLSRSEIYPVRIKSAGKEGVRAEPAW